MNTRTDIGISLGIATTLFCREKFLLLPFEVPYEVKPPWLSPSQVHLQTFLEVLVAVQLFCRKRVCACFLRKELLTRRYLRSFKKKQG